MKEKIARYRKIYKIFVALMLVGFIDSVIVPILIKSAGGDLGDVGFLPRFAALIAGRTGGMFVLWFEMLWFIWGLIAVIANRIANRLDRKYHSIESVPVNSEP